MRALSRSAAVGACARAGITAPILFTVAVVGQGAVHPSYSHVALPISALSTLSGGWIQDATFIASGALVAVFAAGLHVGIRPSRGGLAGPLLLMLSGVGTAILGLFPWRLSDGTFIEPPGHVAGVFIAFLGAGVGLIVISRRLGRDPYWRGTARYAFATGLAVIAIFFGFGALAEPPGAPLHAWEGLVQRVLVAVWLAALMVLGIRLRNVPSGANGW